MIINKKPTIKNIGSFSIQFLNSCSVEELGFRGISHLVEHCMCEKIKDMENEFSKYSLSYNAGTSSNGIVFYLSGIDKYVNKFKYKFLDNVLSYEITKDVFERERNIIIQEYIQSLSRQTSEFIQNFNRKMFNYYGPIGYINDLENITYEKFIEFKNKNFTIPDYLINVSKYRFKKDKKNQYNIKSYYSKPNEIDVCSNINISNNIKYESYSNFEENRCVMYYTFFKDCEYDNYKKFIYHLIFCRYFNEGLTSPLYKNVREKLQCVYSISSKVNKINDEDFMYFTILFTSNDKVEEVKAEVMSCYHFIDLDENRFNDIISSIILDEEKEELLDQMKFEDTEFNKNIKKIIKKMKFSFDDFKYYVNEFRNSKSFIIDDDEFKKLCSKENVNE
jgi:predicted Zn-dependent peptidase